MKKFLTLSLAALLLCAQAAAARQQQQPPIQSNQRPSGAQKPSPSATPQQPRPAPPPSTLGLGDFGIEIAPDPRLIAVMSALDAAGWDPTPAGASRSVFRELVRKDFAGL